MSDEPTQVPTPDPASAPQAPAPATEGFDPARFKAELESSWSQQLAERISGIQSGYQQQLNQRDEEIRKLKNATLTEEERVQLAEQEAEDEAAQYLDDLETRVALAELAAKYPKAAPHIQQLYQTGTLEEQAAYLDSLLNPTPATPEASEQVPPVDANNPPRGADTGALLNIDGKELTQEMRRQILESFEGQSFAQAQGRRG